jgi:hypothetical protein
MSEAGFHSPSHRGGFLFKAKQPQFGWHHGKLLSSHTTGEVFGLTVKNMLFMLCGCAAQHEQQENFADQEKRYANEAY